MVERTLLGEYLREYSLDKSEAKVSGFWDIISEYFTHK